MCVERTTWCPVLERQMCVCGVCTFMHVCVSMCIQMHVRACIRVFVCVFEREVECVSVMCVDGVCGCVCVCVCVCVCERERTQQVHPSHILPYIACCKNVFLFLEIGSQNWHSR